MNFSKNSPIGTHLYRPKYPITLLGRLKFVPIQCHLTRVDLTNYFQFCADQKVVIPGDLISCSVTTVILQCQTVIPGDLISCSVTTVILQCQCNISATVILQCHTVIFKIEATFFIQFWSFQTTVQLLQPIKPKNTALGFELKTFRSRVSSHNHQTTVTYGSQVNNLIKTQRQTQ